MSSSIKAADLRKQLKHPVIDCDGHWIEPIPILMDYVREIGGPGITDQFLLDRQGKWYSEGVKSSRFHNRIRRLSYWDVSNNACDFSTARLPGLLRDRMDDLGIDFAIVYPTLGLTIESIPDPELRQTVVRAYNTMTRDMFAPLRNRMTPVAVIPRFSPEEAIAEVKYAVRELGFKAVMINGTFLRTIPASKEKGGKAKYLETLGLDNEQSYDPLWQTCVDLGVAVTSHGGSSSWPNRSSVSSYVYNHVGHFAEANHAFAKALFLGGVPKRFPILNFAFLEGGTGWARNLLSDLIGHWEKRSYEPMQENLRPDRLDVAQVRAYIEKYGTERMKAKIDEVLQSYVTRLSGLDLKQLTERETDIDDFAAVGARSKNQLADLFCRNFHFGCEADDPMTGAAFDPRMRGRLKAVFSSDFSHWDVPVMADVLPEAFELVEKQFLDGPAFREFTFSNAVWLHSRNNEQFFRGTVIEQEALADLKAQLGKREMNAVPAE